MYHDVAWPGNRKARQKLKAKSSLLLSSQTKVDFMFWALGAKAVGH